MLFHCLLAFIASDEELAVNLIKTPQYMMSHFSLTIFKILSLSLTINNLIMLVSVFKLVGVH